MPYTYSIVIPYRDIYDLLTKAVASIPDREDIQIIIVDNSDKPLDEERIPHKEKATVCYSTSEPGMGGGRARNVGLKQVQGSHILFLDADDYFTEGAFDCFDKEVDSPSDIVFFKADSMKLATGEQSNRHRMVNSYVDNYLETGCEDQPRYRYVNPICKLYKAPFVLDNGFWFDEVKVSNDFMFSVRTGHYARQISAVDKVVYMITEGEKNSSLTKARTAENQFIRFKVAVDYCKFVEMVGRRDMYFHLLSYVIHALKDFGPKEFVKYVRHARKNKVNIFYGFTLSKLFKR